MSLRQFRHVLLSFITLASLLLGACSPSPNQGEATKEDAAITNPVLYFEIPVTDMDRAVAFYEHVFHLELKRDKVDGYDLAFFPGSDSAPGASGALALGDVYKPSKEGSIVYFDVPDIDAVLARAKARGADILYDKKDIGEAGFVAEFEDSEGNRVALTQASN